MSTISHLLYQSRAASYLNDGHIKKILEKSQTNNGQNEISGLLIYNGESFLQLLEGPKDNVVKTYNRILLDSKHRDVVKILEVDSPKRIFPTWNMGYSKATKNSNMMDDIRTYFSIISAKQKIGPDIIVAIFQKFVDINKAA